MSQVVFHPQKLADFISLKRGHDLPESQRLPGEIPVVSSAGITGFHNEAKCEGPGVVTGRYGTLGELHYIEGSYWPLNTTLYVDDFKGNDPRFVYYFLQTLDLAQFNGAGAVPGLNRNALAMIDVAVPEPNDQKIIAEQLTSFDLLADNLKRQIDILEEAARLIYTEWFIRLRFPGHKQATTGTPELPSGWQATSIGTVTSYLNRGVAPSYDDNSPKRVINQKCIRDRQLSMEQARNLANEVSSEKWLQKGDVLVNSTGTGTLGRVAQVREELDSVTVDTHVTIVRPRTGISPWFFGQQLLRMETLFESLGEGATNQTELKRDRIRDTSFLLPSPQVMAAFDEIVEPMIEQIEVLRKQIAQLRQARDLLLPRLMSGQLRL